MSTIVCYCGHEFEYNPPEEVSIVSNPQLINDILEGRFLTIKCPDCSKIIKPEFPVYIEIEPEKYIYMAQEVERDHILERFFPPLKPNTTIVVGYPELSERIRIIQANLVFEAIEILKFVIKSKKIKGSEDEVRIYFNSFTDKLNFHIYGLKEKEIGLLSVPEELYDKILLDFNKNPEDTPNKEIMEHPYISYTRLYLGEDEL